MISSRIAAVLQMDAGVKSITLRVLNMQDHTTEQAAESGTDMIEVQAKVDRCFLFNKFCQLLQCAAVNHVMLQAAAHFWAAAVSIMFITLSCMIFGAVFWQWCFTCEALPVNHVMLQAAAHVWAVAVSIMFITLSCMIFGAVFWQ